MKALDIFLLVLSAAGLGDVADAIRQDMADGKITLDEGFSLAALISSRAQTYFPGQKAELELAHEVAAAVEKFLAAKAAAAAPKA